jgi:plasmid stability protein
MPLRDLADGLMSDLAALAAANGRTLEAEVRVIIGEAVRHRRNLGVRLLERFGAVGGADLRIPRRTGTARPADFG